MAALSVDGTPMPALPNSADQINYDNTTSGLSATTVKGAVDELASEKQDATDNNLATTNKTIVGGINELRSGLTKQVSNSITLPATSNGITTVQIETSAPSGANIIGGCISNVSSYSDSVAIGVYYYGNYARVTCVSPVETTLPSITLNLITTYTVSVGTPFEFWFGH